MPLKMTSARAHASSLDRNALVRAFEDVRANHGCAGSVFECLLDQDLLAKMVGRIEGIIDSGEDSVRIYGLCAGCEKLIRVIGTGEVSKDKDVYIL